VVELLATSCLESRDCVAVAVTGCEFSSVGDCGSGGCGAGGVAVGPMEVVGSLKCEFYSCSYRKWRLWWRGLEAGVSTRRLIFLAYIQGSSHVRKFSLFLSTEICSHLLLARPV
jgi:hypothetical protein